jgi:hypothetical protein
MKKSAYIEFVEIDDYCVHKAAHYEQATEAAGSNLRVAPNRALPDILRRPQIKRRPLKSATTKVHLIKTNWQEVNHEQANERAA